jgi:hypothetical protein
MNGRRVIGHGREFMTGRHHRDRVQREATASCVEFVGHLRSLVPWQVSA